MRAADEGDRALRLLWRLEAYSTPSTAHGGQPHGRMCAPIAYVHPHPTMTTTVSTLRPCRFASSWLGRRPGPSRVSDPSLNVDMSSPSKRIAPEAQRSAGLRYHVAISRVRTNVELMKLCSTYSVRDLRARPSGDLEAPRRRTSGASIVDPHLIRRSTQVRGKSDPPRGLVVRALSMVPMHMTVTAKRVGHKAASLLVTRLGAHAEGVFPAQWAAQGPGPHDGVTYGGAYMQYGGLLVMVRGLV